MSEWIDIVKWQHCAEMARPGIVFEIRNTDDQSMLVRCVFPLPASPFDWKSPPAQFRAVAESRPEHSEPLPLPEGQQEQR